MNKKIVVRTVVGLFLIALLYAGYAWFKEWTKDPDLGSTDTTGMVAAVEYTEGGSQIVLFDQDGKKTVVPGAKPDGNDLEPIWRPDGQRLFFVSDREGTSHTIFRWNVATGAVEQRFSGSRSASSPHFGPVGWPGLADSALVTIGGAVFDFNQTEQRTRQILPPVEFESGGEEATQMEALYQRIGTSFKSAKWGPDRKVMYAVMRREDDEVLIVNYMEQVGTQGFGPVPVVAGQSIQFDVAPDGTAIVAVQGFEFIDLTTVPPELMVEGRAIPPWRNGLLAVRIAEDGQIGMDMLFRDQPDLGFAPEELNAELRTQHGIPATLNGVLVFETGPATAAEALGLQVGDVVTSVGGKPTPNLQSFFNALAETRYGVPTAINVWVKSAKAVQQKSYTFGNESSMALRDPAVSPDSKSVAVVVGFVVDKFTFEPRELAIVPLVAGGINSATRLIQGRVFEPNWAPGGDKLAFAMVGPSGDSQIYVINADGSGQKNLSGPGDYGGPKVSPMTKPKS